MTDQNKRRIFQIGFNRCGTRFLHNLFMKDGRKSVHHNGGKIANHMMNKFKMFRPLLEGKYDDIECFTDMENVYDNIFAHVLFYKLLDKQYPGSKFILNTRDIDTWLHSRIVNHKSEFNKDYLQSCKKVYGFKTDEEVVRKWTNDWHSHHKDVIEYFGDRLGKDLLVFDIEKDDPQKVLDFIHT